MRKEEKERGMNQGRKGKLGQGMTEISLNGYSRIEK